MPLLKKLRDAPGRYLKVARFVLVVLLFLSLYQLLHNRQLSWPADSAQWLRSTLTDYASRPSAGWRKAADTLDELVPAQGSPGTFDVSGRVVRIFDGDTISVLDGQNQQHRIRLHGIDTPEHDQPYGKAAQKALSQLIADDLVGILIKDRDRLGRTVGIVYHENLNVNLEMVRSGHAWWYRQYASSDRPLQQAEHEARQQRLGLWAGNNPVSPWDWRHRIEAN